ncbi:uncharacterized protein LOC126330064 [Schistocerca gregaria]|uniref:uncharacterized protein LOC126330064 n=1 Tax=Schistocerca gregaria TaxID=7010 RepID=UPI00211DCD09|nr:uncharacterized protein LOC126330064 [Schistocerca gregaria]
MAEVLEQQFRRLKDRVDQVFTEWPISPESEREKRKMWTELYLLNKKYLDSKNQLKQKLIDEYEYAYPLMRQKLSLRPHVKRSSCIMGALRLLCLALETILFFPIFAIFFPLRWTHPILRSLGFRNKQLPYDYIPKMWANCAMFILGIQCDIEGWENVKEIYDEDLSTIALFEHSSFIDFIVVLARGGVPFKWIGKRGAFQIPLMGQMAWFAGMISIDRSNLASAKKSLHQAAHVIQHYKRSIAISPEGTRSKVGQLMEFKKGAFHLCLYCKLNPTPIIIFGAYHLWPSFHLFPSSGRVVLRFLKPVSLDKYLPNNYNDMLNDIYLVMANAMEDVPNSIFLPPTKMCIFLSYVSMTLTLCISGLIILSVVKLL